MPVQILGAQLQISPFPLWRLEAALHPGPHPTAQGPSPPPAVPAPAANTPEKVAAIKQPNGQADNENNAKAVELTRSGSRSPAGKEESQIEQAPNTGKMQNARDSKVEEAQAPAKQEGAVSEQHRAEGDLDVNDDTAVNGSMTPSEQAEAR